MDDLFTSDDWIFYVSLGLAVAVAFLVFWALDRADDWERRR